jgi:uncharacterized membrane protein
MSEQPGAPAGGFQFNAPTVVSLLYLATYFTAFSAIVGVVLAYVWRRQAVPEWQQSQLAYLVRTFWLGLGGYALGAAVIGGAALTLSGDFALPEAVPIIAIIAGIAELMLLTLLLLFRCAFVIVNAQQRVPMAKPDSWTL